MFAVDLGCRAPLHDEGGGNDWLYIFDILIYTVDVTSAERFWDKIQGKKCFTVLQFYCDRGARHGAKIRD